MVALTDTYGGASNTEEILRRLDAGDWSAVSEGLRLEQELKAGKGPPEADSRMSLPERLLRGGAAMSPPSREELQAERSGALANIGRMVQEVLSPSDQEEERRRRMTQGRRRPMSTPEALLGDTAPRPAQPVPTEQAPGGALVKALQGAGASAGQGAGGALRLLGQAQEALEPYYPPMVLAKGLLSSEQFKAENPQLYERIRQLQQAETGGDKSGRAELVDLLDQARATYSSMDREATAQRHPDYEAMRNAVNLGSGALATSVAPSLGSGLGRNLLAGTVDPVGQGMQAGIEGAPRLVGALGKEFGARVGETKIRVGGRGPDEFMPEENQWEPGLEIPEGLETVHSLDITPEMRKSLTEQGLPLFLLGPGARPGEVPSPLAESAFKGAMTGNYAAQQDEDANPGSVAAGTLLGALGGASLGVVGGGLRGVLAGEAPSEALGAVRRNLSRAAQKTAGQADLFGEARPAEGQQALPEAPESRPAYAQDALFDLPRPKPAFGGSLQDALKPGFEIARPGAETPPLNLEVQYPGGKTPAGEMATRGESDLFGALAGRPAEVAVPDETTLRQAFEKARAESPDAPNDPTVQALYGLMESAKRLAIETDPRASEALRQAQRAVLSDPAIQAALGYNVK